MTLPARRDLGLEIGDGLAPVVREAAQKVVAHLMGETNTIYVNSGEGWFEDRSLATGLATPSKSYTAFGTNAAVNLVRNVRFLQKRTFQ